MLILYLALKYIKHKNILYTKKRKYIIRNYTTHSKIVVKIFYLYFEFNVLLVLSDV